MRICGLEFQGLVSGLRALHMTLWPLASQSAVAFAASTGFASLFVACSIFSRSVALGLEVDSRQPQRLVFVIGQSLVPHPNPSWGSGGLS